MDLIGLVHVSLGGKVTWSMTSLQSSDLVSRNLRPLPLSKSESGQAYAVIPYASVPLAAKYGKVAADSFHTLWVLKTASVV